MSIQGEGGGWNTVRGGHAPPRAATAVQLAGWKVVLAHQPPSVDWKDGRPVGPPNRVNTYKSLSTKLLAFAKRQIEKD